MGLNQISIAFTDKQKKQLKKESAQLGSSIASVVRLAIREYFKSQEREFAK